MSGLPTFAWPSVGVPTDPPTSAAGRPGHGRPTASASATTGRHVTVASGPRRRTRVLAVAGVTGLALALGGGAAAVLDRGTSADAAPTPAPTSPARSAAPPPAPAPLAADDATAAATALEALRVTLDDAEAVWSGTDGAALDPVHRATLRVVLDRVRAWHDALTDPADGERARTLATVATGYAAHVTTLVDAVRADHDAWVAAQAAVPPRSDRTTGAGAGGTSGVRTPGAAAPQPVVVDPGPPSAVDPGAPVAPAPPPSTSAPTSPTVPPTVPPSPDPVPTAPPAPTPDAPSPDAPSPDASA